MSWLGAIKRGPGVRFGTTWTNVLIQNDRAELDQFKLDALVPALSRYEDDHFLDAYYALFGSLSHYTKEGEGHRHRASKIAMHLEYRKPKTS